MSKTLSMLVYGSVIVSKTIHVSIMLKTSRQKAQGFGLMSYFPGTVNVLPFRQHLDFLPISSSDHILVVVPKTAAKLDNMITCLCTEYNVG